SEDVFFTHHDTVFATQESLEQHFQAERQVVHVRAIAGHPVKPEYFVGRIHDAECVSWLETVLGHCFTPPYRAAWPRLLRYCFNGAPCFNGAMCSVVHTWRCRYPTAKYAHCSELTSIYLDVKINAIKCTRLSVVTRSVRSPAVVATRERGNALDVVRHREQLETAKLIEPVSVRKQAGRIAG